MKTFLYDVRTTEGRSIRLSLDEKTTRELAAQIEQDLEPKTVVQAAEIHRLPRSYNRIKEVPPHMHVRGSRKQKVFKRDEDGLVRYWSGSEWNVSRSFWRDEELAGGFFVEFFGDLPQKYDA